MNPPRPAHAPSLLNPQPQQPMQQRLQNQVIVPIAQSPTAAQSDPQPPPLPPNLPCGDLIQGSRKDYLEIGVPLYEASIKGDWKAAYAILCQKPELVRFAITKNFETPLHIAASAQSTKSLDDFVKNLVCLMEKKDLELQNKSYNTALILAATAGNVEIAKIMVAKNKCVLEISGSQEMLPLYVAAFFARHRMVRYLYEMPNSMSVDYWKDENRGWVLQKCVEAHLFDVAVKIAKDHPTIISNTQLLRDILVVLAQKTRVFEERKQSFMVKIMNKDFRSVFLYGMKVENVSDALKFLRLICNEIGIMGNNEIDNILQGPPSEIEEGQHKTIAYPSRVPFIAAENGNVRFIIELLRIHPDLIWTVDDRGLSIFHVAVEHRQENVYNLLYEIGSMRDSIITMEDKNGNNMLHLVAKTAKSDQDWRGLAFQMQHELLWFMDVWQIIPPFCQERKNVNGETPYEIFTKDHKKLQAETERWMKEIVPQCLVGATIIATIAFTAAFTPPGGYDQKTGIPVFFQKPALRIFIIADALSLLFSSTSILILLIMLIRRYAKFDFIESLPKMLMFAFGTLYLSIVTMIVAFCASCLVLYNEENFKWVPIMVVVFASIIVFMFNLLNFSLLTTIFRSTYRSRYLFNPKKRILYY